MIFRLTPSVIIVNLLTITTFSCASGDTEKKVAAATDTTNTVSPDSAKSPSPFTIEDAESLTGKYYNQENQVKKYAYYNSMAISNIKIDSNYHSDTILVTAHTTGRIWPNPNKDTVTSYFAQDLVLKVYRYKQIWWADKLQDPEAVNAIPELIKK